MSDDLDKLSFEKAFGELETTVQRLEEGDLTLDQAISLYERGMHLARRCGEALDAAELQVQELALVSSQQQLGMFFEDGGE
jgi:exodeoxyribonuclease VII small subunit